MNIQDLSEIFEEVVDLTGVPFGPDSILGEDIPVDSREMLRILSRVESRRGKKFEPRQILRFKTVGDILNALAK